MLNVFQSFYRAYKNRATIKNDFQFVGLLRRDTGFTQPLDLMRGANVTLFRHSLPHNGWLLSNSALSRDPELEECNANAFNFCIQGDHGGL